MTSFLQCTIQSFRRNAQSLDCFLNSSGIGFSILSEIFLPDDNVSGLKFSNYYSCRVDGYGGMTILFRQLPCKSSADIVIVKASFVKLNLAIASCYFKPNTPLQIFRNEMQRLRDFNSRYSLLENIACNNWSKTVFGTMRFSSFVCLTKTTPTLIHSNGSVAAGSALDLAFQWNVSKVVHLGNSRHISITFHVSIPL